MTENEFAYWKATTENSQNHWMEDDIFRLNGHGHFYYFGGEDGVYMEIEKSGLLTIGKYEGAYPHIGEATFNILDKKQHEDFNKAFESALQYGGKRFLADLFSSSEKTIKMPVVTVNNPTVRRTVFDQQVSALHSGNTHISADFQCDQTEGFPSSLCVNWDAGLVWLARNESLVTNKDEQELDFFRQLCADWGIRPCGCEAEFNEYLLSLGDEAYDNAAIPMEEEGQVIYP